MRRRSILAVLGLTLAAACAYAPAAIAQQPPIKIGMSMPQTGGLAAGGKAALIGIEIWLEDINAKGGLLGRKVELIVYDDQTSAADSPAIYTKLLDVDKVDLLIAPYAHRATAPIMPLVKERGLLLMGNFSFQVNAQGQARHVVQQRAMGTAGQLGRSASSISAPRPAPRRSPSWPPTRSSPRTSPRRQGRRRTSARCRSSTSRTIRRAPSTSRR